MRIPQHFDRRQGEDKITNRAAANHQNTVQSGINTG
jgi:hypothetical protein